MSDEEKPKVSLSEPEMPLDEELVNIEEFNEDSEIELTEEDALRAENSELKDRLMRALAEAENQRKRGERDRRDAEIYGGRKLARDLLSVYDNMKRALDAATDEQRAANKAMFEGIDLTQRELVNTFAKHQITPITRRGRQIQPRNSPSNVRSADASSQSRPHPTGSGRRFHDRGSPVAPRKRWRFIRRITPASYGQLYFAALALRS